MPNCAIRASRSSTCSSTSARCSHRSPRWACATGGSSTQGYLYNSGPLVALPSVYRRNDERRRGSGTFQRTGGRSEPERRTGRSGRLCFELPRCLQHGLPLRLGVAIVALLFSLVIFLANKKKLPRSGGCRRRQEDPLEGRNPAGCPRDQTTPLRPVRRLRHRDLLLVLVPPERSDADALRAGLIRVWRSSECPLRPRFSSRPTPFCVVFLTPIVIALFSWLRNRGKEPSTPMKIAIGMGIAAFGLRVDGRRFALASEVG